MRKSPDETKASFIRARAIRMADTLSRVTIPEIRGKNHLHEFREIACPPVTAWPEIDVDNLLPWNSDGWIMSDDGTEPAIWPIDHALALPMADRGVRIAFATTVLPRDLRGKIRRVFRHNVRYGTITVDQYGALIRTGGGLFGRVGKRWVSLEAGGNFAAGCLAEAETEAPGMVIGNALRQRYEWSAVFSYPSGIRLRYGCSAAGALKLFRDRDAPEEGRRAALLHWVRQHWRRTSDPAVARQVREHLRGITRFEWRRQEVSLIPAEYELERAA